MVGIEPGATCLDEEFLWDSKQLGAHSPSVLLSTILYYCTKELMLKTVAMHQVLAFSRVQRLVRKDSRGKREAYIRFLPSEEQKQKESEGKGKKRPLDIDYSLELRVNTKQPLRCPVKLYEFYISKCPESVKTSRNIFYLVPERACVPDSPLWYSDKAVPDKMVERFLWRHLIVKDIHEHWEMLKHKNEEGESSGDDF
ncbi:putative zinc finger MYM-type protein 3 [Apostichopus japonicus]|uniref:Putative zinc finger MYM-type protein 3 n=2 Tax=Stichopus japonicus TaxID=307972 RepID=A0A2G8KY32_STIJA|nr:putative zinc finger MYM-type protein 3 [Apostichopus japonicus]